MRARSPRLDSRAPAARMRCALPMCLPPPGSIVRQQWTSNAASVRSKEKMDSHEPDDEAGAARPSSARSISSPLGTAMPWLQRRRRNASSGARHHPGIPGRAAWRADKQRGTLFQTTRDPREDPGAQAEASLRRGHELSGDASVVLGARVARLDPRTISLPGSPRCSGTRRQRQSLAPSPCDTGGLPMNAEANAALTLLES